MKKRLNPFAAYVDNHFRFGMAVDMNTPDDPGGMVSAGSGGESGDDGMGGSADDDTSGGDAGDAGDDGGDSGAGADSGEEGDGGDGEKCGPGFVECLDLLTDLDGRRPDVGLCPVGRLAGWVRT